MLRRGKWDRTHRTLIIYMDGAEFEYVIVFVDRYVTQREKKLRCLLEKRRIGYAHMNWPKQVVHTPTICVAILITLAFMCWHAST